MIINNSEFMLGMFFIYYELICFIILIKLLFYNIFIGFFDY